MPLPSYLGFTVSYGIMAFVAIAATVQLIKVYPFGSRNGMMWVKYLPLLGLALILLAAGRPLYWIIPGIALLGASAVWAERTKRKV